MTEKRKNEEERIRLMKEASTIRDMLNSIDYLIEINNIPIDLDWKPTYNDPDLHYLFESCGGVYIRRDDD